MTSIMNAKVVKVQDGKAYVNIGSKHGVIKGDHFEVGFSEIIVKDGEHELGKRDVCKAILTANDVDESFLVLPSLIDEEKEISLEVGDKVRRTSKTGKAGCCQPVLAYEGNGYLYSYPQATWTNHSYTTPTLTFGGNTLKTALGGVPSYSISYSGNSTTSCNTVKT